MSRTGTAGLISSFRLHRFPGGGMTESEFLGRSAGPAEADGALDARPARTRRAGRATIADPSRCTCSAPRRRTCIRCVAQTRPRPRTESSQSSPDDM